MPKPSLNDFLSPASFWPVKEITFSSWVGHAPFAMWLMDALRPSSVVELGTHNGFSFWVFNQAAKELGLDTELYAIDSWEGDEHAGVYDNSVYEGVQAVAARDYPEHAHLVRKYFDDARPQFADGSVDLVHVDGRHFYEDARHDVDTYLSALSNRGVMILHDIVVQERGFGVYKVWEELQERYPTFGFTHCYGLGVVAVGEDVPPAIKALTQLKDDSDLAELVRAAYTRLGAAVPTPWIIEDPGAVAALERLLRVDVELAETRAQLVDTKRANRELAGQVNRLETDLRAAEASPAAVRQVKDYLGRAVNKLPEPVARAAGVVAHPSRITNRLLRREVPPSDAIRELFDADWYGRTYGVTGSAMERASDYMSYGAAAGRNPNPLFDGQWYAAKYPDLAPLSRVEQAEHFVRFGGLEGRSPHPFFDSDYYLSTNADIVLAEINPLIHYLAAGDAEGRRPNPYFDPKHYREAAHVSGFAAGAYLESPLPRVAPSAEFDPEWYLATYEDAAAAGGDPLLFHLEQGGDRPTTPGSESE